MEPGDYDSIVEHFFSDHDGDFEVPMITEEPSVHDQGIWPDVETLIWSRNVGSDEFSAHLIRFPNLKTLIFNRWIIPFGEFPPPRGIEYLYLHAIQSIEDYSVFSLESIHDVSVYQMASVDIDRILEATSRPGMSIEFKVGTLRCSGKQETLTISGWQGRNIDFRTEIIPVHVTLTDCPNLVEFTSPSLRSPDRRRRIDGEDIPSCRELLLEGDLTSLKLLNAMNFGHVRGLANCRSLTSLDLSYGTFRTTQDLEGLSECICLKNLKLFGCKFLMTVAVSDLINIKWLRLQHTAIDTLNGLEYLENLKLIEFHGTPFADCIKRYAQDEDIESIRNCLLPLNPDIWYLTLRALGLRARDPSIQKIADTFAPQSD